MPSGDGGAPVGRRVRTRRDHRENGPGDGLSRRRRPARHYAPFVAITPDWVPVPHVVILLTGLCEIAGALALSVSN